MRPGGRCSISERPYKRTRRLLSITLNHTRQQVWTVDRPPIQSALFTWIPEEERTTGWAIFCDVGQTRKELTSVWLGSSCTRSKLMYAFPGSFSEHRKTLQRFCCLQDFKTRYYAEASFCDYCLTISDRSICKHIILDSFWYLFFAVS